LAVGCGDADTASGDEQDVTEAAGRFELFTGEDGQRYFQLLAGNGEQLLRSEGYTSLSGAKNGVDSVKRNGVAADNYRVLEAVNGEYYFNLVAQNGEIIATGETYKTLAAAERAVETLTRVVEGASTAELDATGPRFESFVGADGQSYFRLRAGNGEIVLQSEGYASPSGAEAGMDAVEANGTVPDNYVILEAANGQHYFNLVAANHEIIGRGELYVSKYNAQRGAETVRRIIRDMTDVEASDDQIQHAAENAAEGLYYISEGDYPYLWVHANLAGPTEVTEDLVRDTMAAYVDNDPDADSPLAELYSMSASWDEWRTTPESCLEDYDPDDDYYFEMCGKKAALDKVLGENLSDIQVYYFGSYGGPDWVDGVAVSIIVVGITPEGNLAGMRTIAIWT
jgi:uncharacterized protein YegP (UPF0339 family)